MRLLDLFCGAGGAAMGYSRAGFEVVGVDIEPQANYPFEIHYIDALQALKMWKSDGLWPGVHSFDVIHASPPCRRYSSMSRNHAEHLDLYQPTYQGLVDVGKPYVIENVIGAPYGSGLVLCGSMFGLVVRRHRNFEMSHLVFPPSQCRHEEQGQPITVTGSGGGKPSRHSYKGIREHWPRYMEMPWATPHECTQAVPPAYTEFIGKQLKVALR